MVVKELKEAMEDHSGLHVVMFPWLAFGHMILFLELSKALAKKGHHTTYVSTPRNLKRLPPLPPNLTQTITFVALPFPSIDGLPDQAEATSDLPLESVEYLKKAYDELKTPFTTLISARCSDWIIHDFASYWLPDVASDLGVPCAYFSIFPPPPAPLAVWEPFLSSRCAPQEELTSPPELADFPTKVSNLPFEAKQLLDFRFAVNASGVSDALQIRTSVRRCRALLVRGCHEFKSNWLALLAKLYETRIIPLTNAMDAWMPSGFEERINGRGFIQKGWILQMKILAHEAIGGFLTEKGIGVEVPRDALDGSVTSDDVAKTLRLVMVEEGGAGVRSRVGELKSVW
ncbi:putative UDP-rhamnose:rhamnosyltransferase 1 [Acorus calamus]|uniref:UDP-rhamnose:rhamnosyltransferase 1 n=1 Tax=Acorus calamus TaxID=4465 RepID=A0AAV9EVS9_ACOCL|nr:putative UDP-rhamnose:rhamnosyltransferase 1 [Acorus calamus]